MPIRARVGSNFTLSCKGAGNPKPTLRWKRNATQDLVEDARHVIGSGESVTITQATAQDSGLYECIATNLLGSSRQNGTLVVQGWSLGFNGIILWQESSKRGSKL